MPLQEQVIPIDFGGGVDTKTDPKLVVPGKFLSVQNGVFTSPKRITKRNGYQALTKSISGGGTLSAPKLIRQFEGELVCADGGHLYAYSQEDEVWISKGPYTSIEISKTSIDQGYPSTGYVDSAINGNYLCSVWSAFDGKVTTDSSFNNQQSLYMQVKDLQSGVNLTVGTTQPLYTLNVLGRFLQPKVVPLSATKFGIFYVDGIANSGLKLQIVTINGNGTVSVGAALAIVTYSGGVAGLQWDVTGISTGAAVAAYTTTTNARVVLVNSSGAVTATSNTTVSAITGPGTTDDPIFISEASNGNFWVYVTPGSGLSYFVLNSSLASVLAPTSIATFGGAGRCANIISYDSSSTSQVVVYGYASFPSPSSGAFTSAPTSINLTSTATVTTGGTVTAGSTVNHITPYSRSIVVSGNRYAVFLYIGSQKFTDLNELQTTFFLVDLATLTPIGRFGFGVENILAYTAATVINLSTGYGISYAPSLVSYNNGVIFPCASVIQEVPSGTFTGVTTPGGIAATLYYTFDFGGINTYTGVVSSGVLVLGGGQLMMYDGAACVELGFNVSPEINNLQYYNTSGSMGAGTYSYLVIYQWTDNQGNFHQSQPSLAKEVVVAAGSSNVEITVLSPVLTSKTNVSAAIFRTEAAGTVYYQVTSPILLNTFSSSFIQFKDGTSDADLVSGLQAYTYPSSAVLENTTPPPATVMVSHSNRLWFRDDEERDTIWYTKTARVGVGISPSGFLSEQLDSKFGEITSLAEMDDKIVIFKDKGIFVMSGDGASDTGTGSTLSTPQAVPSDVGCSSFKSCITTPSGVMFQSDKGIYLVGRSLSVVYIGMDVERFNAQTFIAATLVNGKSQIRFLTSSGTTLVYDYIFNKWGEFTNHEGYSSDNWEEIYIYTTADGDIFQETEGEYLDDTEDYALALQTGWLALGSVQGFQRVRRLIMLGDYANGSNAAHGMQVQIAYDFSDTFEAAVPFTFGAASSSGTFQYRERLPQQKCDAISLLITENSTGDSGDYIDLTNISFEAGVKRGVNKLASTNSVG